MPQKRVVHNKQPVLQEDLQHVRTTPHRHLGLLLIIATNPQKVLVGVPKQVVAARHRP